MDDINDYFKNKGYDGIFDIEDGLFAQYPVILHTPIDSIKLKSYERF